jgi:serine/threonine protein kinase
MRSLTFNRIIGSGAMGTVYLAELREQGLAAGKVCAVKVMKSATPDLEQFRARMRDEARLLGLLRDDKILGVSELLVVEGCDCVVMEYVEGVDLADLVRDTQNPAGGPTNPLPAKATAELGAQLAATLHRAHQAVHPTTGEPLRVIHRDIKPSNVMLTRDGSLRLLDFSVARAAFSSRESHTQGLVLGTLNYFPPEILKGSDPTPAVDLYGLGLTLWEAATGRDWGTPQVHQHRFEKRVEQRLVELGPAYEMVVPVLRQLLSWRPEDRPDGASAEKRLAAAAHSSPGPPLARLAQEKVPPMIERKLARATTDDRVGRTFPIEGSTNVRVPSPPQAPRRLEKIDPLLSRLPAVTETFNDLAPPAAVSRKKGQAGEVRALSPSLSQALSEAQAEAPTEARVASRGGNRAPVEDAPEDTPELPLDPTTSEAPTVGGIQVLARSAPALPLSSAPTLAPEPVGMPQASLPTLIHVDSLTRPPPPKVAHKTPPPTPPRSVGLSGAARERSVVGPVPPAGGVPGPSLASTAALLLAAALFGAVVGVTLLLAILFVAWLFVG